MTGVIRAMRYSKLRKAARKSGLVLERASPEITKAECSRCTHDVALSPTSAVALRAGFVPICMQCWRPDDITDDSFILTSSERIAEMGSLRGHQARWRSAASE